MRKHLRIDGKALRGAARGGRAPMLLSGIWDDGTTAAQLPVDTAKTNEITVFRQLLGRIAAALIRSVSISQKRRLARNYRTSRYLRSTGGSRWSSRAGDDGCDSRRMAVQ